MFYNLNDVWTKQIAEIAITLLNQFNITSTLLYKVSTIRLFSLQKEELASTSPLNTWTPLQEFHHYRFNNITAHLYLLKQSNTKLTFRCNNFLTNQIIGGSKAITDTLPLHYL